MVHDSRHSDGFVLSTDYFCHEWYHITHLNFVSQFVTNLVFGFSLHSKSHDKIDFIGLLTAWFELKTFPMVHMALAHAQKNYFVLQVGQWYQDNAAS